jgi:hypothetical protein
MYYICLSFISMEDFDNDPIFMTQDSECELVANN